MKTKVWTKFLKGLLPLAVFAAVSSIPLAVQAQNVGSVRGTVTDPSSAVVPGVKVVATGNGVTRNATSNGQGQYTIPNLPPGKYSIRADAPGFVTFLNQNYDVPAGQANSLDIALQIAQEAQQVSVQESTQATLSVDSSSNVSAIVLKDEDLDQLPDDPDDLQADLEALAGPAAGPNGAQFFVDGFSGGQLPPKSSIREIRINSNPFSSEYDRPGFGRVEILTRPGTDNFHGQINTNYGNRVFDSRNPFLSTTPPAYWSNQISANFGGPINKKSSFFMDYNRRQINEDQIVVAQILDPGFNQVQFNSAIPVPNFVWQISPRIDYAINQNNTLVLRYNHTQSSNTGGVGGFNLQTQETQNWIRNNQVQITETSVLGTVAVDETRFQFRDNHNNSNALGDFTLPGIDVSGSFNSGGAPFGFNHNFNKGYELANTITMSRGAHALKLGVRIRQTDVTSISTGNFNGTWSFSSPQAQLGGQVCPGVDPQGTSLDVYQQTIRQLAAGVPIATLVGEGCGPSQFSLSTGNPNQQVRQFDLGGFVQDDWRVAPNFTLNAGLRYETQDNIHDHMDWAPRVGLAWAPGAKGKTASKTVFRAGYGIFFDRVSQNTILSALRYNGVTQTNYLITAGSGANATAALSYFCIDPFCAAGQPRIPPTSILTAQTNQALYVLDQNLRAPYMGQFALEVDRQLPGRTQLSINYVNTRGVHQLRQRDINAPLPGTYVPATATTPVNPGIRPYAGQNFIGSNGDIYEYETSAIFKQTQLTINANTRLNSHLQLQGYYTYGQAHTNGNGFPVNQYDESTEWGRANFDIRNRGFLGGSVGLPLKISLNPFITMQSGGPFNITTGQPFDGDGIYNARPAFATGCPSGAHVKGSPLYNTPWGCFTTAPGPNDQLIPVNYGQGPSEFTVNLRASRTWGWGERAGGARNNNQGGGDQGGGNFGGGGGRGGRGGGGFGGGGRGGGRGGFGGLGGGNTGKRYNLTATISARNAFNHVNLANPAGSLISPFFGTSTALAAGGNGGGFGGGGAGAGNRKVELQLRFQF